MRSHESINAIKSLFSEEFQAKTIRARLENKKDICVLFLLNIYTQLKKTYSDITPSLTSFLGSEKKKRKTYNLHIHSTHWFFILPVCSYQYKSFAFRSGLSLSSKCIQDVLYYFASFGKVIMQFSNFLANFLKV